METAMRLQKVPTEKNSIPGWGADLHSSDRPGVPREANQENVLTARKEKSFPQQKAHPGVMVTIERPKATPVFGTAASPIGPSRWLRTYAFAFSENELKHWLLLLIADRVNMVEGWVEDIFQGKAPMILPRMELRTFDHLRRIRAQGIKGRQDSLALVGAGAVVVGLGALAWILSRKPGKAA